MSTDAQSQRPSLDATIAETLTAAARRAAPGSDHEHVELMAALSHACSGGGRLRPQLLLDTCRALGGDPDGPALHVAAAIEILHAAFVLQDDVIDADPVRRGAPTAHAALTTAALAEGAPLRGARRYGDAGGTLAGDLGLITALTAVLRCGAPATTVDRLVDLLESAVHASAAGELADVAPTAVAPAGGPSPTPVTASLRVAALKTSAYTTELPLRAGAVLAGADEQVDEALAAVGRPLGIGFQLLDDLVGIFGDESRTGKSALSDLRDGARTGLIAHAEPTDAWPLLLPLIGDPDADESSLQEARRLLEDCGARARTEALAEEQLDLAVELAISSGVPDGLVVVLDATRRRMLETAHAQLVGVREVGA